MVSLDKLPPTARYPKGRYKVRYKKPDGSAGSRNFVRRDEAVRFQQANGADIDRGDWIDPRARRSKFDSWAASYERSLGRLAPLPTVLQGRPARPDRRQGSAAVPTVASVSDPP